MGAIIAALRVREIPLEGLRAEDCLRRAWSSRGLRRKKTKSKAGAAQWLLGFAKDE